jgi:hypothetical protein
VTGTYEVAHNIIVDNLATSRLIRGITLASAVPIKVHLPGNVVTVSGSDTTSYLKPIDDYNYNTDTVLAEITQTLPALTASHMPNALLAPTSRIVDGATGKWWTAISTGAMVEGALATSAINGQFKLFGNPIIFSPNNVDYWLFNWDGVLAAFTDNTTDVGYAAANRPRTIYAGTSVVAPTLKATGAGSGVLVKSPDGNTCKILGIDNAGAITATAAACP